MKELKHIKENMTDEEIERLTTEDLREDLEILQENLDEVSKKSKIRENIEKAFSWIEEEIIDSGRGDMAIGIFILGCLSAGGHNKKQAIISATIAALRLTNGIDKMIYNNVKERRY